MDSDKFYAQGRFVFNGVYRLLIDKNTVGSASRSCKINGTGRIVFGVEIVPEGGNQVVGGRGIALFSEVIRVLKDRHPLAIMESVVLEPLKSSNSKPMEYLKYRLHHSGVGLADLPKRYFLGNHGENQYSGDKPAESLFYIHCISSMIKPESLFFLCPMALKALSLKVCRNWLSHGIFSGSFV